MRLGELLEESSVGAELEKHLEHEPVLPVALGQLGQMPQVVVAAADAHSLQ